MGPVQEAVEDIVGHAGDPTIIEYLVSCLELEDETAKDAAEMYSNYGSMLVDLAPPLSPLRRPRRYFHHACNDHTPASSGCRSGGRRLCTERFSRTRRLPAASCSPAQS